MHWHKYKSVICHVLKRETPAIGKKCSEEKIPCEGGKLNFIRI